MSWIIKEPFAPPRRHLMIDYSRELGRLSFFYCHLKRLLVMFRKASLDALCMIVLLVSLLVTTLLLPWIVL